MGFSFGAMWNNKCPVCRQGNIFTHPIDLFNPLKMPHACEHCGQKTEPEPGFYFGAMMMSYIISTFLFLPICLLLVFYFGWTFQSTMFFLVFISIVSYLKILRGSRSLWLHMMIKHNPKTEKEVLQRIHK